MKYTLTLTSKGLIETHLDKTGDEVTVLIEGWLANPERHELMLTVHDG